MSIVIAAVLALLLGIVVGAVVGKTYGVRLHTHEVEKTVTRARTKALEIEDAAQNVLKEAQRAKDEAQRELDDAKAEEKRILDAALAKFDAALQEAELETQKRELAHKTELENEKKERLAQITANEARLVKKEELLDKRSESLDQRENELKAVEQNVKKATKQVKKRLKQSEEMLDDAARQLESVAQLSRDEAKAIIMDEMTDAAKLDAIKHIKQITEEAEAEAEKNAKTIMSVAIQRFAGEYVAERSVKAITLPSDEVKGRIIGREGRNIRSIETATGVDVIVDDTPETVVISAFDPIRREIAAQTLKRLIADGRIHPGRIEETVAKVRQEVEDQIKEAGEQAFFELGIQNVDPQISRMVGKLKYRTSYGQNIWVHSIEAAWLCGIMAAELGLDVKLARRVGLLHDIGKAMDHEQEGSHAILGAEFLRKHGESDIVVNAVASHHAEEEPQSVYAHLAAAADALSGARPGARREILESYIKRLEDIEKISMSFEGVEKCYAIQAGREIRVIVEPDKISDDQAAVISHDIARRIENELTYPGRIKVCVIRETRAVDNAR
ncbi:MAG: ribonuclease Y [Bradymonadia bacterium]